MSTSNFAGTGFVLGILTAYEALGKPMKRTILILTIQSWLTFKFFNVLKTKRQKNSLK